MKKTLLLLLALLTSVCISAQKRHLSSKELQKQREALIALYNSTDGDHWINNTNWCTDAPLSDWYGVYLDYNGGIMRISLMSNNLVGTLPEELGNISTLKLLECGVNKGLHGTLPESLGNLQNIEYIHAGGCNFEGAVPESYLNMKKMENFRIYDNHFTSIPSGIGDSWPKLESLYLEMNDLTELPYGLGQHMDVLIDVSEYGYPVSNQYRFTDNKLTGKLPEDITSHKNWDKIWQNTITQKSPFGLDLRGVDLPYPKISYYDIKGELLDFWEVFKASKHTLIIEADELSADDTYLLEEVNMFYKTYHKDGLDMIYETVTSEGAGNDCHVVNLLDLRNQTASYSLITRFDIVDDKGNVVFTTLGNKSEDDPRTGHTIAELITWLEQQYGPIEKIDRSYTSTDYSMDGNVRTLQKATRGNGVDIVIMGEAYTDKDIADGTYDEMLQSTMEGLFSVEPMISLRDLFNVYAVDVVSPNGYFYPGSETALHACFPKPVVIEADLPKATEYAKMAVGEERINEATVVITVKNNVHAGICYRMYPAEIENDYGSGLAICLYTTGVTPEDSHATLIHEGVGHGFGKLGDEYYNEGKWAGTYLGEPYEIDKKLGYSKNVEAISDPTQVKWARFITDARYADEEIGVYEGAMGTHKDLYRPTKNSVMCFSFESSNFNVPSREAIWIRAHKLAFGPSWEYDYEEFVAQDLKNVKPCEHKSVVKSIKRVDNATCGEDGARHYVITCTNCWKEIDTEVVVLPATGEHQPSQPLRVNEIYTTSAEPDYYELLIYCTVCYNELSREEHGTRPNDISDLTTDGAAKSVYSLTGIKQQGLQKGLNIIRYSNGKIIKTVNP